MNTNDIIKNFKHLGQQEYGGKMVEMCIFPKKNRVAGIQDIKSGRETIGWKIRFDKKPSKPQKHIRIKVVFRLNQPIYEVRPELVNSKFPLTTTSSKKNQFTNGTTIIRRRSKN